MLKVTTEPLENCEVAMTVEVDEQQTDRLLKAAARRISRQVKIPGFRPGKAPYNVIVRRFGEEVVREEALEDLSQSVFKEALEQAEMEPYAPASLEEVTWDPLVMKVRVPTQPVVELGHYRAMRMEVEPVEVGEGEVDEALERLQMKYAVWNPVERPAQVGDLVTMSIKEQVGEEVLNEDENFEYELTQDDEEDAEPDLVTPLISLSAGEEKEFTLTYPETYGDARYAGQEVTAWAKLHTVKERELFPLDDDFAQTVGDFDSLEELKEKLAEDIYRQKQDQADAELGQEAIEQLIEHAERIEWPKVLEEEEIDAALDTQDQRLKETGLNLDMYLSVQKKTRQELREEIRPAVQERLRRSLAVSKLVELEDLSIEGHEITDQIDRLSMLAGERGAELREALAAPENVRSIASDLLSSRVVDRLVQIVKGEFEAEAEEMSEESEADTQLVAQAKEEKFEEEIIEEAAEIEIEKEVESDTEAAVSG